MAVSHDASSRQAVAFVFARAISSLGSSLTTFALNVWVYRKTGSYTTFATLAIIAALPALVLAPACGLIVDRFPRKAVLIACELTAGFSVALLAMGSWFDRLTTTAIGALIALLSIVRTVSWPAASAAITTLCLGDSRQRINGLVESLEGAIVILGPLAGAALLQFASIPTIACIDLFSYLLCVLTILILRFPRSGTTDLPDRPSIGILSSYFFGFRWIFERHELSRLLIFFAVINLGCAVFVTTYTPYVLSFATPLTLARCFAVGGMGTLLGGAAFAASSGFRRKEIGVLLGALLSGISMASFGICRSPSALYAAAFAYGAAIPLTNASSQTIWQERTPVEFQGRVFSVRKMIAWALNPISILLSIPMASALSATRLTHGQFKGSVTILWDTGQTGTLGLMASACGLICFSAAAFALTFDWLRMPQVSRAIPKVQREHLLRPDL